MTGPTGPVSQFDCQGKRLQLDYGASRYGLALEFDRQRWLLAPVPSHQGTRYSDERRQLDIDSRGNQAEFDDGNRQWHCQKR